MLILLAIILCLLNLVWLALIVVGLPGTWLMVLSTALLAWYQRATADSDFWMFSVPVLITIAVLALAGELAEFLAATAGSKKAGGTRWGAVGAIVGGLIGGIAGTALIPVPVLGSLIGACGGAALGAGVLELTTGQAVSNALRSGYGAGVGRFFGTVIKLAAGVAIWLLVTVSAFWP